MTNHQVLGKPVCLKCSLPSIYVSDVRVLKTIEAFHLNFVLLSISTEPRRSGPATDEYSKYHTEISCKSCLSFTNDRFQNRSISNGTILKPFERSTPIRLTRDRTGKSEEFFEERLRKRKEDQRSKWNLFCDPHVLTSTPLPSHLHEPEDLSLPYTTVASL